MAVREVRKEYLEMAAMEASRTYAKIPKGLGIDRDDLESAANAAIVVAIDKFPELDDDAFCARLRGVMRNKIKDEMRKLTGRGKMRTTVGLPEYDYGEVIDIHDLSSDDPAEVAEAVEEATAVLVRYESLPSPLEAAAKASALKAAILAAISVTDVKMIVEAQVREAKEGDGPAARFIMQLIGGINS